MPRIGKEGDVMASVRLSVEGKRGCGFRKGGGLYLVGPKEGSPCGKLPIPLEVCPTCGEGFPYSRAPRWVDTMKLKAMKADVDCTLLRFPKSAMDLAVHDTCPMSGNTDTGRGVLLWVGAQHYKTPEEFLMEGAVMGFSRRVKAVPRGFVVGETWVLLAHVNSIERTCEDCSGDGVIRFAEMVENSEGEEVKVEGEEKCRNCKGTGKDYDPGWFAFFRPTAVEYVITGDESDEELDALEEKGYELVEVVRKGENGDLFEEEGGETTDVNA